MSERPVSSIVDKQVTNLTAAVPQIVEGVNAVTESPTAKAADNLDKAAANYVESIRSGKMARNLRAVSVDDWKKATSAKATRIGTGIEEARDKLTQFHTQRQPFQKILSDKIDNMPSRTIGDSGQRMLAQMNGMAKFSFDKGRS